MKYISHDNYELEEGEPVLRSCWECNGAHEHLKDVTSLHFCVWCGRYWIYGHYLTEFNDSDLDGFLKSVLAEDKLEQG